MPNAQPTTKELIAMLYERLPELFERSQRKPLTDEQRCTIIKQECRYTSCAAAEDHHRLIKAIETFHGIKE